MSTRDRILDAFEELVIEQGDRAATLDAVAARAGVSKGGLIYHFATREELIEATAQRLFDSFEADLAHVRETGASAAAYYLSDPPDLHTLSRSVSVLLRMPSTPRAAERFVDRWSQRLADDFPDDPVHAELVRLVGDGLLLQSLLGVPLRADLLTQLRSRLLGPAHAAASDAELAPTPHAAPRGTT